MRFDSEMDLQLAYWEKFFFHFMLTLQFNEEKTTGWIDFSWRCDEMSDEREKWKINFPLRGKIKKRRSRKENKKIMSFFTCLTLPIFLSAFRLFSHHGFKNVFVVVISRSISWTNLALKEFLKLMENVTSFTKHDWWILWCLNIFFNLFPSRKLHISLLWKSDFFIQGSGG